MAKEIGEKRKFSVVRAKRSELLQKEAGGGQQGNDRRRKYE